MRNIKSHLKRTIIVWRSFLELHLKLWVAFKGSLQLFRVVRETRNIVRYLFLLSMIRLFGWKAYYGVFIYRNWWIRRCQVKLYGLWLLNIFLLSVIPRIDWAVSFILINEIIRRYLRIINQFLSPLSYSRCEHFHTDIVIELVDVWVIFIDCFFIMLLFCMLCWHVLVVFCFQVLLLFVIIDGLFLFLLV